MKFHENFVIINVGNAVLLLIQCEEKVMKRGKNVILARYAIFIEKISKRDTGSWKAILKKTRSWKVRHEIGKD